MLHVSQLKAMILRSCEIIISQEPYLTEIDSIIGDGDHGTGMKRGFRAVQVMLESNHYSNAKELFRAVGMELVKTMGGASGVIFGTLFIGGLDCLPERESIHLQELSAFFKQGFLSIERRGKAHIGQKTMLDALAPAVFSLEKSAENEVPLQTALQSAYEAACNGSDATSSMQSRTGRSKNFREKSLGLPDPGAVSTAFLFQGFYEAAQCIFPVVSE